MSYAEQIESAPVRPGYVLHSVRGVVWAAVLGSPLAAGIVMAINYARAGNKSAARLAALIGAVTTVAFLGVLFAIPEHILDAIPNVVFWLPQLWLVYAIAKSLQSGLIERHAASGGPIASAWWSAGIGALCLPFALVAIFGMALLFEPSYGNVVEFGGDEVYYSGDATEADARKLGEALQGLEYFGQGGASVRIESAAGQSVVSFMLVENAWDEAETVEAFRLVGQSLGGTSVALPLKIQLCDEYFTPKKTLTIE